LSFLRKLARDEIITFKCKIASKSECGVCKVFNFRDALIPNLMAYN